MTEDATPQPSLNKGVLANARVQAVVQFGEPADPVHRERARASRGIVHLSKIVENHDQHTLRKMLREFRTANDLGNEWPEPTQD